MKLKNLYILGLVFMFLISFVSAGSEIARYEFNTGSGSVAVDTLNNKNLTLTNVDWSNDYAIYNILGDNSPHSGDFSNALSVASSTPFSEISYTESFSISMWVDLDGSDGMLLGNFIASANRFNFGWKSSTSQLYAGLYSGSFIKYRTIGASQGKSHIVVTHDPSDSRVDLYYNNTKSTTTPSNTGAIAIASSITIGARSTDGSDSFEGLIDDVRIYNYKLSDEEVENLFNYGDEKGFTNFTITAQDNITETFLKNFTAIVNGNSYNTTDGTIITDLLLNESIITDISVWSDQTPGYFNATFENINTSSEFEAELYKKNSVLIQTYWENGTRLEQEFDVRFTSDLPSTFLNSTNSTGGLFYNNLSIAEWEISVFNSTNTPRKFYVDVEDYSFTRLNVYFPLPENQELKTFSLQDSLKVAIENGLITFTKFIDSAFVSLGQIKTDSTGTATIILNNGESYRLIIEADGFDTKVFNIGADDSVVSYTITLLTDTSLNFTTILDRFTYTIAPTNPILEQEEKNFTFTTSSEGSYLEWFYLAYNSTVISNVSGSPAGGTALINLNLTDFDNEKVTITYGAKVQGFEEYVFTNDYFVYTDKNYSTSVGSAKEDFQDLVGDNIILGAFFVAVLVLLISFLFPVDQVKGTKSLNGIILLFFIAFFSWLGLFPVIMSIMVCVLILLSIIGGGA